MKKGQIIARIKKPEGNAIDTQLHFSLQIDGKNWDPVYFIKITYRNLKEVMELIEKYEKNKNKYKKLREDKIREYKLKNSSK